MSGPPLFTADCPRCGFPKITMEIRGQTAVPLDNNYFDYEILGQCRKCFMTSIFSARKTEHPAPNLDEHTGHFVDRWFYIRPLPPIIRATVKCPEHVPDDVERTFNEAAKCFAMRCWDASGTMYRKVLDVATRALLPPQPEDQSHADFVPTKTRRDLRPRLDYLFGQGKLPATLKDLASCIHQDGNEATHAPAGIGEVEANDLQDFTVNLLEAAFAMPGRIRDNNRRREERHSKSQPTGGV